MKRVSMLYQNMRGVKDMEEKKPMRMTEEEAMAHDLKMEKRKEERQEMEAELYCHRQDCPIKEERTCPEGEVWPRCSYGRDWDK